MPAMSIALDQRAPGGVAPGRAALAVDRVDLALGLAQPDAVAPLVDDHPGVGGD